MLIEITESVSVDLDEERWQCSRCAHDLGSARGDYKRGSLVAARDPREIHGWSDPADGATSFAPDPAWCRIVEFYCPGCATLLEVEYLPPGHPLTYDIELDVDALKRRYATPNGGSR